MSNIPNYNPNNMTSSELRPEHHAHDSSEPLPGAAGGRRGPDYSAENMDTKSGFGGGTTGGMGGSDFNTDTAFGSGTQRQERLGSGTTGGMGGSDFSAGNMDIGSGLGSGTTGGMGGSDFNTDTGFGSGNQRQDKLSEFGSGTTSGMGGSDFNTDTGFGTGTQRKDKLGEFESGTTGGMGGSDFKTDTGFGSGTQRKDKLGEFGSGTTGGMGGSDFKTDTGFGSGTQRKDKLGEFGSGTTGGMGDSDFSAKNTDTGFGGDTQRQDRLGEFGNSGLDTSTGKDKPAKVNFGETKDYDPSGNDLSAAARDKPEMFRATEGTTTQGSTGVGRREHETPSTMRSGVGDETTRDTQGGRGTSMATGGNTTKDTEGAGRREHEHASTAKPSMGDKIAGGAQKIVGKMMKKPEMEQKGELRETGGKAAVN